MTEKNSERTGGEVKLSIVTTMYHSSRYLGEFYDRVTRAARLITHEYELIFVNDGSPDDSLEVVLGFQKEDKRIVVIDLSRNFGHHKAMITGLQHATGERVFLLDCDLEEDPAWLAQFHEVLKDTKADVVYGVQQKRKGGLFERVSGDLFYRIFNRLGGLKMPQNWTTARLMTQRYIVSLLQFTEREPVVHALMLLTGYSQVGVPVTKGHKGRSTYTFTRKLSLAVNALASFSERPLIVIFNLGVFMLLASGLHILFILYQKFFRDITIDGWTSLIVSIWFLGGLTIFCIGIIGIYLARVFVETKQRPISLVRAVYRQRS